MARKLLGARAMNVVMSWPAARGLLFVLAIAAVACSGDDEPLESSGSGGGSTVGNGSASDGGGDAAGAGGDGGAGGEGGAGPTSPPMDVAVTNAGDATVFVNGLVMPLAVRDEAGTSWPTDAGWQWHCDDCDAICETGAHGEPCPTYAELPPGATVTVRWDRRVWTGEMSTCPCGGEIGTPACAVLSPAPAGPLTIELPYRTDLPGDDADYSTAPLGGHPFLEGDEGSIRSDCADGPGLPVFDQVQSAPLPSIDAEAIDLPITLAEVAASVGAYRFSQQTSRSGATA